MTSKEKTDFKIQQFEKFYYFLTKNTPEGYTPWFFPCAKNGKNPSPQAILKIDPSSKGSWHHESARLTKEQCIDLIKQGYNIGISARNEDSLIIGDLDSPELLDQIPNNTLTTISRKRCGYHFFGWDKDGTAKINCPLDDGEMRSLNQYVLAPGSYVPFDLNNLKEKEAFEKLTKEAQEDGLIGFYTVGEAIAPRELTLSDLPEYFRKSYETDEDVQIENEKREEKDYQEFKGEGKYSELLNLKMSDIVGAIAHTTRNGHPLHDSDTDANFSLSKDGSLAHCWRHLVSINPVQYLCILGEYSKCQDAGTPHEIKGKPKRYSKIKGDKKALAFAYDEAVKLGLIKKYEKEKIDFKGEDIKLDEEKIRKQARLKLIKKKIEKEEKEKLLEEEAKKRQESESIVDKVLEKKIDKRFEQNDLLIHINEEISKDHIEDDREKLATFGVGVTSQLPNPRDHVSVAHKGDSSTGKTNMQLSVVKHFPQERVGIATRITQSEMEDRINSWDLLVITEINKFREGANAEITETFKQCIEGGIRIFKKDNITGKPKEIEVEQKSGFFGTTEHESDSELETRYILIPVSSSVEKNKKVVGSILDSASDMYKVIEELVIKESWISKGIRKLDKNLDVVIPFAKELKNPIKTEEGKEIEIFDYSKERVKRDIKRLLSLTKGVAWLFQKRRAIIKVKNKKILLAEPTDFITALKIYTPFFNISYSGLDPRIENTLEKIKELQGNFKEEITNEFMSNVKADWIIRSELQKELKIDSVNTIKNHIAILKDRGLINVSWNESHPRYYLIQPINQPINNLLQPIIIQALTGGLLGKKYKEFYKKHKKQALDSIKLPETVEIVKNHTFSKELTGVSLTGVNSEKDESKKEKQNIDFKEMEL